MSRREFLALTAGLTGAGLSAGCAADERGPSSKPSGRPSGTPPPASPAPPDAKSVLVVGAGMAGLAAARSLTDAGWPVRLIEARDRIGGRINTTRDWGVPLEMGASWIHGAINNPLMDLAKSAGAQLVPTAYYKYSKLALDPRLQPVDYDQKTWHRFVPTPVTRSTAGRWAPRSTRRETRATLHHRTRPVGVLRQHRDRRRVRRRRRPALRYHVRPGQLHRRRPARHPRRLRRAAQAARRWAADRAEYAGHRRRATEQLRPRAGRRPVVRGARGDRHRSARSAQIRCDQLSIRRCPTHTPMR